jgi:hypothetical protein
MVDSEFDNINYNVQTILRINHSYKHSSTHVKEKINKTQIMKRTERTDYHWEIQYIDIDPDTGSSSESKTVATTKWPNYASTILDAFSIKDEDPNRHYFIVKCVDHKIREAYIKGHEDRERDIFNLTQFKGEF